MVPNPPQTIISLPVQTAVWSVRASGALVVLVAVQVSVLGLYRPPVFNRPLVPTPPQTIISLPIQTAVCANRALRRISGAGGCPGVRAGIVSPTSVKFDGARSHSAPDDHFTAGPQWRVEGSRLGRISGAGGCPGVSAGIVSPTSVKNAAVAKAAPTIISLPVQTAVCPVRASGALVVLVAVQVSVLGLYRPPVLKKLMLSPPPQTIISLPVQTAVCPARARGALVVLVAVQVSVLGWYLPPVSKHVLALHPPQMIISLPVQTAEWSVRASGVLVVLVESRCCPCTYPRELLLLEAYS